MFLKKSSVRCLSGLVLLQLLGGACSKKNDLKTSAAKVATVTTYSGSGEQGSLDGVGTKATFSDIMALAIDGSGNLYLPNNFLDGSNSIIRRVSSNAVVSTVTDNGADKFSTLYYRFGYYCRQYREYLY